MDDLLSLMGYPSGPELPLTDIPLDELAERMEAAQAYAEEDDSHYVEYYHECKKESLKASEDIRKIQDECWKGYQLEMDYSEKEDWQSKAVLPDPFMSIQQAKAIVRKAFDSPNYFTVEGVEYGDKMTADFVRAGLGFWFNAQHAKFPVNFCDATEMAFAIGLSHEVIPRWDNEKGLIFELIEPWKIYRDPDAKARDPWSGMYWIHDEWMDLWQLHEMERQGIYAGTADLSEDKTDGQWDHEKEARRKEQYWTRSKYRKGVLTGEVWGTVLDRNNEVLLPNGRYTVAGDKVILKPEICPFVRMRWPGTSFSPYVHLLRYEGRGIIQNVLSLWWLQNNMLNLHMDALNWAINKIREIDPSLLLDPSDTEVYPGVQKTRKAGAQGPAITVVEERGTTGDVLPNMQFLNQKYENGCGVNQFVAGLPGSRSSITLGETKIKTQQSMGLFDSIGADVEAGAVNVIYAAYETLVLNWTGTSTPSPERVFGQEYPEAARMFSAMPIEQRKELLRMGCDIKVSGIAAQLKQAEMVERLQYLTKLTAEPRFEKYTKPYELLSSNAEAVGDSDAKYIVTPDEAKQIDQIEAQANAAMLNQPPAAPGLPGGITNA